LEGENRRFTQLQLDPPTSQNSVDGSGGHDAAARHPARCEAPETTFDAPHMHTGADMADKSAVSPASMPSRDRPVELIFLEGSVAFHFELCSPLSLTRGVTMTEGIERRVAAEAAPTASAVDLRSPVALCLSAPQHFLVRNTPMLQRLQ